MIVSAAFALLISGYVIAFDYLPESWKSIYTFGPVFFLIIIAYGGARMARKTYLVDYAPAEERPLYVSVANTFMGLMTLLSGVLSLVSGFLGVEAMILALMFLMILAIVAAIRLKEI